MDVTKIPFPVSPYSERNGTKLMDAVMEETGITATAGIGTNLYLAKDRNGYCGKTYRGSYRNVG